MSAGLRPMGGWEGTTVTVMVPGREEPVPVTITCNKDSSGRIAEVFVKGVPAEVGDLVNALARVVSCALQAGVEPRKVIRMLRGQRSAYGAVLGAEGAASIPDAIARRLRHVTAVTDDEL